MTTTLALADLTRPIIGIENRTPQEVFDMMCARITGSNALRRSASVPSEEEIKKAYIKLVSGGPVGGGDGNTYIVDVPSLDRFRIAVLTLLTAEETKE